MREAPPLATEGIYNPKITKKIRGIDEHGITAR
jgi:hypothetical protein